MERYKNLSGDSGVLAFKIGGDSITVEFQDGGVYLYTYSSAGKENIEQMKSLAISGKDLCTFINKYVKENYAQKVR